MAPRFRFDRENTGMPRLMVLGLMCGLAWGMTGCQDAGPPRKQTFPVKGQLVVDGQPPQSSIQIQCHNVAGMDTAMPTISQAIAHPDGGFEIATYQQGDGVPPGDYVLTFNWQAFNAISMSYGGPDKFNGRYNDPKSSTVKFTVKDRPVDLGTIELSTK
jgi:hypothetical protein